MVGLRWRVPPKACEAMNAVSEAAMGFTSVRPPANAGAARALEAPIVMECRPATLRRGRQRCEASQKSFSSSSPDGALAGSSGTADRLAQRAVDNFSICDAGGVARPIVQLTN